MISVQEASQCIQKFLPDFGEELCELSHCLGRVLSRPISADRLYPPFHRVCMDGIAISHQAWHKGQREFAIEHIVKAGDPQYTLQDSSKAIEVMTGAPCPTGCDIVIRIEDCNLAQSSVQVTTENIKQNQNIHTAGTDYQKNDILIPTETLLRAPEIAILASVGSHQLWVKRLPKTAVLSTGDELVEVSSTPLPHQIRRSNSYQIAAAWEDRKLGKVDQYHLRDNEELLQEELLKIITHYEVIILSGGVSMGKFDFIPKVLQHIGVQQQFHKIAQKPGKPLWFGVGQNQQLVFGLPGNPVSTAVCLSRYALPILQEALSLPTSKELLPLAQETKGLAKLSLFLPVRKIIIDGKTYLEAQPTKGSGDFASLVRSDGFVELHASQDSFPKNKLLEFYPW